MRKYRHKAFLVLLLLICFNNPALSTGVSNAPSPATSLNIGEAIREYRELSAREKKARKREARRLLKTYKAEKRSGNKADNRIIFLAIIAIFLPPLAVFLKEETINSRFWICLLLSLLFLLPGIVYAMLVVFDII
jgi:uncharacterized membrane protein YqaE (UPF0057 family)